MKEQYSILDLFCGTGSFAHGFLQASEKFKLFGAIDILENATETVKRNHPNTYTLTKDIRDIDEELLKNFIGPETIDLIIGGPPCQGFSSLRPNRSSNEVDSRNNLYQEFVRVVDIIQPQVFVLENVVGILTHKKGETLSRLLDCFEGINYKVDWRVLNAANYGVPQKRERFILIGSRLDSDINFPEPTHSYSGRGIGYKNEDRMIKLKSGGEKAITVIDAISDLPELGNGEKKEIYNCEPINTYQKEKRKNSTKLTLHEASNHSKKMLEIIRHSGDNINCIPDHLITSGFSSCYSRMRANEPANTITVKFRSPSSSKCIHPFQDRSITIREAARLQGFDDDYKFAGSNTEITFLIGNAVPSLLGKAIAQPILELLSKEEILEVV